MTGYCAVVQETLCRDKGFSGGLTYMQADDCTGEVMFKVLEDPRNVFVVKLQWFLFIKECKLLSFKFNP